MIFTFVGKNIYVLLLLSSLLLGAMGAWFISSSTYKVHLLDHPTERSSHEIITPKGGGVGILVAFILASALLNIPTTFVFSAMLVSLVSFYADSRDLSARLRLVIHFMAAFLLILPFVYDAFLLSVSTHQISMVVFFLALLYIVFVVGTANFFNFMDGINGLAGITGMIGFGLIILFYNQFLYVHTMPVSKLIILAGCIVFSCLGFLPFNMPRARVFMGDVGSLLLGFVFAGLVVRLSGNFLDFTCMASFLFLFYADVLTTMWIRFRDHEKLTDPHRRHLYQLLANEFGIAHWKVTMLYGAVQLMVGVSVISIRPYGLSAVLSLLTLYFIAFTLTNIHCRRKLMPI